METTEAATPTDSPKVLVDEIKEQISTLETQVNTLRDTLVRERARVRDLYTSINDEIQSNELDETSTLTYRELSDYLVSAFGNELSFLKEYEAEVHMTVKVIARFWATDDDAARDTADSIELSVDTDSISWSGDGQDEISEVYVDDTRIRSIDQQ
jgi:hypothetical protein